MRDVESIDEPGRVRSTIGGREAWLVAIGLALIANLFFLSTGRAGPLGVDVYGFSYHFGQSPGEGNEFNQVNPGGGLDWVVWRRSRQTLFVDLGIYKDSFRQANRFVDVAWTHSVVGPLQAGAALAIFSTRSINDGELLLAPVPMVSFRADRVAAHVVYLIKASNLSDFSALGAYVTVYPFQPARVRLASRAPGDSARATGLELTVIPDLGLAGFESATIGIRRRRGDRGWRLAADVAGMIQTESREVTIAPGRTFRTKAPDTRIFALEMRMQWLRRLSERNGISLFGALGPIIGYTNRDPDYGLRLWHLGAALSCGAEYRVASRVSLEAEYGFDLIGAFGRREREFGEIEDKLTSVSLSERPVRLGLTAWFR